MVNAPPTPPATTPAELQDEARGNTSIPEPTASSADAPLLPNISQDRPEAYQTSLVLMGEAIARSDYAQLVNIAEKTDITVPNDRQQSRLLIIAPLILGHLILDELTPARYAFQRLPDNLASLPLSRALAALTTSTMNREHAGVYDQVTNLNNLVLQPDFPDRELGTVISTLLSAFIERFRERTFSLLAKAYTSLSLSLACIYLSWTAEKVVEVAQKHAWSYDSSSQILIPARNYDPNFPHVPATTSFSSLATFGLVADSVARLEE